MKSQILKSIYLLCSIHFAFCIPSIAQIVYTDLIPDQTFNTNSAVYHLDFDNNGTTDFDIQMHIFTSTPARAEIFVISSIGNFVSSTSNYASDISLGISIDNSNSWMDATIFMERDYWIPDMGHNVWHHHITGNWLNKTNEYLGFKFSSGGNNYFGWARLDTHINSNGTTDFTIKDYAYNATANQSILAGDSGTVSTGIINYYTQSGQLSVYPNPAANYFTISLPNINKNVEVSIADINGKINYKTFARESRKIEVNTIDFAEGIYYVSIQTTEFIETRKLIVAK